MNNHCYKKYVYNIKNNNVINYKTIIYYYIIIVYYQLKMFII